MSWTEAKLSRSEGVDRLGMVASSLCAAHCAVCALLPALFGALGLGFLLGQGTEWAFTLVAIAFATGALVLGWKRHRSRGVALLLMAGIAGLLFSRCAEGLAGHHHEEHPHPVATESADAGAAVGVLAGLLLLAGHLLNLRASRCCPRGCS